MKIQKGGIILVAPDGEDANNFLHQTRSRDRGSGKSPTKFLGHVNSPCRICPKRVTDENSLTCDKCEGWVHFKCSSLTKHEFDFLSNSPKTKLRYFCVTCETSSPAVTGSDPVLIQEARLDAMDKKFEAVESQNKAILDLLRKDEKKPDVFQATVQEVFDNSKEKDEKKNNLILFNLPETENTDDKQSQIEDLQRVKEVLSYVNGGYPVQGLDDSNVTRMGIRKTDQIRPRAIKLQFSSSENKMKILRNAKHLAKHDTFRILGISPDKTLKERNVDKERRRTMLERNAKGEDLVIYRDEIIPRSERPTYNSQHKTPQPSKETSNVVAVETSDEGKEKGTASPSPSANAGVGIPPGALSDD